MGFCKSFFLGVYKGFYKIFFSGFYQGIVSGVFEFRLFGPGFLGFMRAYGGFTGFGSGVLLGLCA